MTMRVKLVSRLGTLGPFEGEGHHLRDGLDIGSGFPGGGRINRVLGQRRSGPTTQDGQTDEDDQCPRVMPDEMDLNLEDHSWLPDGLVGAVLAPKDSYPGKAMDVPSTAAGQYLGRSCKCLKFHE
jgi:hypothetical protein